MRATLQRIISCAVKALPRQDTQHYTFHAKEKRLLIYLDEARRRRQPDADQHALFIGLGCVLENAVIAANAFGYREKVTCHFSGEQDYVELALEPAGGLTNQDLFAVMEKLHANASPYIRQRIPADQLADLVLASKELDVFMRVYDTEIEKASLLPYVEEAVVLLHRNKGLRKELSHWLGLDEATGSAPGEEPGSGSATAPPVTGWMGKFYRRHFQSVDKEVHRVKERVEHSAALLLFTTLHYNKEGWVNLGRSCQRIVLKAATMGISHSLVNMPCEEPSVRRKLKEALETVLGEPLLLVRLGYAEEAASSELRAESHELRADQEVIRSLSH